MMRKARHRPSPRPTNDRSQGLRLIHRSQGPRLIHRSQGPRLIHRSRELRMLGLSWLIAGVTSPMTVAQAEPPTAAGAAQPVLIDGLAAALGGSEPGDTSRIVILRSDVELRARLALLGRSPERALFAQLRSSLLRATLDELVGEELIAAEAERVQIAAPSDADVARERAEIEREAGGRRALFQLLARMDASQLEIDAMARRRALISAFLRANLEGATAPSDRDVDARLQSDPERYADFSAAQARALVRAEIAKEALMRDIERWVRVLRARTRIRIFAQYEPT